MATCSNLLKKKKKKKHWKLKFVLEQRHDELRGIHLVFASTNPIPKGETLLRVARNGFLSAPTLPLLCSLVLSSRSDLAQETLRGGARGFYLDSWSDSSVSFCPELLSPLREQAQHDCHYSGVPPHVFWAVRSRSFQDDFQNRGLSLIPTAEFINHDPTVSCSFDIHAKGFTLFAPKSFACGQEVVMSYGENRSNEDLLFMHGFSVLNNPNDEVVIRVGKKEYGLRLQRVCNALFDDVMSSSPHEEIVAALQESVQQLSRPLADWSFTTTSHFLERQALYNFIHTKRNILLANLNWMDSLKPTPL